MHHPAPQHSSTYLCGVSHLLQRRLALGVAADVLDGALDDGVVTGVDGRILRPCAASQHLGAITKACGSVLAGGLESVVHGVRRK